jgi:hypothetical protein
MPRFRLALSAICVLLVACGWNRDSDQPHTPEFSKAFANLPLPPDPELVSKSGSSDALQLTIHTPMDVQKVTDYYRQVLSGEHWRLMSDSKNPDGSTVLYAEQNGPPLWVRIWALGDRGTMVELTGAVLDTAKAQHGAAAPAKPRT